MKKEMSVDFMKYRSIKLLCGKLMHVCNYISCSQMYPFLFYLLGVGKCTETQLPDLCRMRYC